MGTIRNNYVCIPRRERLNERRATFLAAIIGAVAAIAFISALYYTVEAFVNIGNCGNAALAGYERVREMDRMPTLTRTEIRRRIERL